jgi:hypothetical protein
MPWLGGGGGTGEGVKLISSKDKNLHFAGSSENFQAEALLHTHLGLLLLYCEFI